MITFKIHALKSITEKKIYEKFIVAPENQSQVEKKHSKYLNNLSKYFQWILQPLQTVTNCRMNKLQNNSTHYSNYLTTYISLYFVVSLFHLIFHHLTTYITTYIVKIDR